MESESREFRAKPAVMEVIEKHPKKISPLRSSWKRYAESERLNGDYPVRLLCHSGRSYQRVAPLADAATKPAAARG